MFFCVCVFLCEVPCAYLLNQRENWAGVLKSQAAATVPDVVPSMAIMGLTHVLVTPTAVVNVLLVELYVGLL
jgi:hypothetical protein